MKSSRGPKIDVMNDDATFRQKRYFAAPSRIEGTWMVLVQAHPRDLGRGVLNGLPSRQAAEAEASRLNWVELDGPEVVAKRD